MARPRRSRSQVSTRDRIVTEGSFPRGIVRDMDAPQGGLYDCVDWLVEQQGMIYKRGGWERHSDSVGAGTFVQWVGTIHNPTRVVCIDDLEILYDVTSENAPTSTTIGTIGFHPNEHSPTFYGAKERLIVCDSTCVNPPKTVRYDSGTNAIVIEAMPTEVGLGANPPAAAYSVVHNGMLVLGRGAVDFSNNLNSRIWFSLTSADVNTEGLTDWQVTQGPADGQEAAVLDMTHEVTGLASIGGVLLIFGPNQTSRVLGYAPPGPFHTSADMQLQPFTNVGCLDARSIAWAGEALIFAGEEGVWITNGSSLDSLTFHEDGTGIQAYWRSLFPRHHSPGQHNYRQLVGGSLNRDFYIVSVLGDPVSENNELIDCLLCHIPTKSWTRVSNVQALSMAYGRDEQQIGELYFGSAETPHVNRLVPILYPATRNMTDGDGTVFQPTFTTRNIGNDFAGMKAYGFGWLTYRMLQGASSGCLRVTPQTGMHRWRSLTSTTFSDTDTASSLFVNRRRFPMFVDTQAMWLKVDQTDSSELTEINFLEAEERAYVERADSLGV
jgi:hypothetical protein